MSTLHYLKTLEKVIRDWSLDREDKIICAVKNNFFNNPNLKSFGLHPEYDNKFLAKADAYNSKNKLIIKLRSDDGFLYFIPGRKELALTKDKCREYLDKIKRCDFDSFDKMFEYINSIRVIKLDASCWQLSECSCKYWMKIISAFMWFLLHIERFLVLFL